MSKPICTLCVAITTSARVFYNIMLNRSYYVVTGRFKPLDINIRRSKEFIVNKREEIDD